MRPRAGRAGVPGVEVVEVVDVHLDVDGHLEQVGECIKVGQTVLVVVVVLLLHAGRVFLLDSDHVVIDVSRLDHQRLVVQVDTFGVDGWQRIRGSDHEGIQGLRLDLTGGVTVMVVLVGAQRCVHLRTQGAFRRGDGGRQEDSLVAIFVEGRCFGRPRRGACGADGHLARGGGHLIGPERSWGGVCSGGRVASLLPAIDRLQVLVYGELELEPVGVDAGDGEGVAHVLAHLLGLGDPVAKRPGLVGH